MINRTVKYISKRNSAFQRLEVIARNRAKRTRYGEIFVEGVIPINLCVESRLHIKGIYFTDYEMLSDWAKRIISRNADAELFSLTPALLGEVSEKEETSEILVVAEQPRYDARKVATDRIVILDRPSNPGNFGTIARTCDSFGIDAIFISGHGVDPYDAKSIAASRGTVFTVPIIKIDSNDELSELINLKKLASSFTVYGSSADGEVELRSAPVADRFALVVGNETTGMTPFLHALADYVLKVPILGHATSLNIACATSILLYELTATPSRPPSPSPSPENA